ncbi:hypothetical protein CRG98_042601, partial [Punica granatum]
HLRFDFEQQQQRPAAASSSVPFPHSNSPPSGAGSCIPLLPFPLKLVMFRKGTVG